MGDRVNSIEWGRYRNKAGKVRWHAWTGDTPVSLCKHLDTRYLRGSITDRTDARPDPATEAVCKACVQKLDKAKARGQRLSHPRKHTGEPTCACDGCREARRAGARKFVEKVEVEVDRITCACVRAAVESPPWGTLPEWREMVVILEELMKRLRVQLLLWEMTGDRGIAQDAGEVRSFVLEAWETVTRRYNGPHFCESTQEKRSGE